MHFNLFPKTTYVSSFKKHANFYYRNSMLICTDTDENINYISAINFPNILIDNNIINNISLNLYLSNSNYIYSELKKSIAIYKIIEDFNIKNINWENFPNTQLLYIDENDIFYDDESNILSLNISSIISEITGLNKSVYGLSIMKRCLGKNNLLKYYSSNSSKPPFISINYSKEYERNKLFIEKNFLIESIANEFYSKSIDISIIQSATYFIKNLSSSSIYVYLQISPNNFDFIDDIVKELIPPNESIALSLGTFLKYSRLKFINQNNNCSKLNVWFQCQMLKYNLL